MGMEALCDIGLVLPLHKYQWSSQLAATGEERVGCQKSIHQVENQCLRRDIE
jgi:hypothetical protein